MIPFVYSYVFIYLSSNIRTGNIYWHSAAGLGVLPFLLTGIQPCHSLSTLGHNDPQSWIPAEASPSQQVLHMDLKGLFGVTSAMFLLIILNLRRARI